MFRILFTALVTLTFVVGCSSSSSDLGYHEAQVGKYNVSWKDLSKVSKLHKNMPGIGPDEGLYMFTRTTQKTVRLSNGMSFTGEGSSVCMDLLISGDPEAKKIFRECHDTFWALDRKKVNSPPLDQFVKMAEQAVKEQGACQWLGYDRALDMRARATGSLARLDDNRLFFAKLRCS